jgi:hypothetical protein
MGANDLIKKRRRLWIVAGLIAVLVIILGIIGPKALLVLLLVPAALFFYAQTLKLKGTIESVRRVHWVTGVREFENGTIVIDRSGMTDIYSFSVPTLGSDPQPLGQMAEQIENQAANRSLLLPRVEIQDSSGLARNEVEAEICRLLDKFARVFSDNREEKVEIAVLDKDSPELNGLEGYAQSLRPSEYVAPVRDETSITDNTLKKLAQMNRLSRTNVDASPIEDTATRILSVAGERLNEMNEVRRRALVDTLGKMLNTLSLKYRFPMLKAYCPRCLDQTWGVSHAHSNTIIEKATSLQEKIEKYDEILRTARLKLNSRSQWECPMCHAIIPDEEATKLRWCERLKEELVYPLWDVLWMELSSERAEVLREKEQERRDALNRELVELDKVVSEFGQERRLIRSKLDDLNEMSLKTGETLRSMIRAFTEYEIINSSQANKYEDRVVKAQASHHSGIDAVGERVEIAHNSLGEKSDVVKKKRKPIIDTVDEVKVKGRFFDGHSVFEESNPNLANPHPDDRIDDNGGLSNEQR